MSTDKGTVNLLKYFLLYGFKEYTILVFNSVDARLPPLKLLYVTSHAQRLLLKL